MSEELRKKAVELLLHGATLVAEPCPYCRGVRVIKDGSALCISCGRTPDKQMPDKIPEPQNANPALTTLNKKLEQLTAELEAEKDLQKQQQILKSINSIIETIQKLQK